MITLIEALNFRSLRYVRQSLGGFHVLVGPNASGKTTFLDVIAFLGDFVSGGIESAVGERTGNFQDLLFAKTGTSFQLAIEAALPKHIVDKLGEKKYEFIRYELSLGMTEPAGEIQILAEKTILKNREAHRPRQLDLFPSVPPLIPQSILTDKPSKGHRTIVTKVPGGNDNFYSEVHGASGKGWLPTFKLGPRKSALANLPEDETKFPATTWLKRQLLESVQRFVLNSLLIRKASPPGQVRGFKPDGSNLPWVIETLSRTHTAQFTQWINHLRTALPDLKSIHTVERADDRFRYLVLKYENGLEIPSWMASDGTLRMLALTLPAYLPDFNGIYLIEEPENGIHPKAVESAIQSLSSVYNAQILLASHSTVILSLVEDQQVLCFAKTRAGETDIVRGDEHPALKQWKGKKNLGILLASGILG